MGMFTSLFGKSGSDKADQMRQKAIDAFMAIQTPELKDLQVQLDKYVQGGRITPEQAESELLRSNAFNDIVSDPSLVGAQKQALQQLQKIGTEGGLTAVDRAQLNDIQNEQNQANRSQNEATMQRAQERGMGGSDLNTINQLINEQGNANRASNAGLNVAAQAQARALQAMQAAGKQAGDVRTQDFGEAAKKAEAENAIDLFNKQTLNATNLYNVDAANKAQAANLAEQQRISDSNINTANNNKIYNSQQVQNQFQDNLAKANGVAGTYNQWGNEANANANADHAADVGFTTGLIKAGAQGAATAFAGPAGGMAAGAGMEGVSPQFGKTYSPTSHEMGYAEGGEVSPEEVRPMDPALTPHHPDNPQHLALGGNVKCYAHGGEVHHHPTCYMAGGGDVPDNVSTDEINQSFMRQRNPAPKPAYPVEWNEGKRTWDLRDRTGNPIGSFETYVDALGFADKVKSKEQPVDFRNGGPVPGTPAVPHNSLKNDVVDAKLSPGEVVVPLDAQKSDEDFEAFMNQFKPSKKEPKIDKSVPLDKQALTNLRNRGGK